MFKTSYTGILLAIIVFLPMLLFSPARCQIGAHIGPHFGIQKSQDAEGSNYLIGVTLRLRLLSAIGAEGDIGYRQEKFGSDAVTVQSWPITFTGLLYPLPVIYGGLGGGWYGTTFDYADVYNDAGITDETMRKFGWHLAAGVELPASPSVKLFGDIRYVFLNYKFKELPGAVLDGADANFYSLNFGILFHL
ncbi:MAG: outer membrane beta-barrel protein [Candidatus Zixiibacteriota bacterium]